MEPISRLSVLWVDDEIHVLKVAERFLRSETVELYTTTSPQEAQTLLIKKTFAVIISDQRMPVMTGVDLLIWAKQFSPSTVRILLTGFSDTNLIIDSINRASVFRILSKPWDEKNFRQSIEEAIEFHKKIVSRNQLLKELSGQNRRLEELTNGLENLVANRTSSIEQSRNEVQSELEKFRRLIRFIKELSLKDVPKELFWLLKIELLKNSKIVDVILHYRAIDRQYKLLQFRSRREVEKIPFPKRTLIDSPRYNYLGDSQFLADQLGRPFGRVLCVPLRFRGLNSEHDVWAEIFIEHNLGESEIHQYLDDIQAYLHPFSIALDRSVLEFHLKSASYQWEKTFDATGDPIAIVDIDFDLIRANRAFVNKSFAKKCYQVFMKGEETCVGCPVATALKLGKPQMAKISSNGKIYQVHSYPIRIYNENHVTNAVNYYFDITEEQELYSRVIQNEKMAALGTLAGNIAHELNNPLTGIRSLAQVWLQQLPENSETMSDLIEVEKAAGRSQKIIKNLLEFTREGQAELIEIGLDEIVRNTIPMLKTAMRTHRSQIHLSSEYQVVRVEQHLMQQVVYNLVNNACQAMGTGGHLEVETKIEDGNACLIVRDDGPGISPSILKNIFDPFFTTKEEGKGTGLGLTVTKSIVEKFEGKILVASELGKGTEFKVSLPVVEKKN